MNILLDTHTFIWWTSDRDRLPKPLMEAIRQPANAVYLSVASSWEAMIKLGLGKLRLEEDWNKIIDREIRGNALRILPVKLEHTYSLARLPPLHRDPFDRMLIAQAIAEGFTLATMDPLVNQYPLVSIIWD
jgi:PIN domain nuclease of toxin-antitoxin system